MDNITAELATALTENKRLHGQFDALAAAVGWTQERCEQDGDSPFDCANDLRHQLDGANNLAADMAAKAADRLVKLDAAEARAKDILALKMQVHKQLEISEQRVRELEAELKLNAAMLARQCDLARQAEAALTDATAAAAYYVRDEQGITPRRALERQALQIAGLKAQRSVAEPVTANNAQNRDTWTAPSFARSVAEPVTDAGLNYLYWSAYHAGHHDTVEGQYIDVLPVDRFDYWQDRVQECVDSGDMSRYTTPPSVAAAVTLAVERCEKVCDDSANEYDAFKAESDITQFGMSQYRKAASTSKTLAAAIRALAPTITAEAEAMLERLRLYDELIYAVSRKYPDESRHETALRYIRNAESQTGDEAKQASANTDAARKA